VKQKYGSLRIYFSPKVESLTTLYTDITARSSTTCEICGKLGKYCDKERWLYVLCDVHAVRDESNFYDESECGSEEEEDYDSYDSYDSYDPYDPRESRTRKENEEDDYCEDYSHNYNEEEDENE
jgi:hypothetical protein